MQARRRFKMRTLRNPLLKFSKAIIIKKVIHENNRLETVMSKGSSNTLILINLKEKKKRIN
jgi:hypothetical protein